MSKGFWILLVLMLSLVGLSVVDIQWSDHQEQKKQQNNRVFKVDSDQITEIRFIRPAEPLIELKKDTERGWVFIQPVSEALEYSQATDLVGQLSSKTYQREIASGDQIDWSIYGLDSSDLARIELVDASGKIHALTRGNRKNFEGHLYARPSGSNQVLMLDMDWENIFDRSLFQMRDKRILKSAEGLHQVEIQVGKRQFNFLQSSGQWGAIDKPEWKIDQNKLRELLFVFTSQAITEFKKEEAPSAAERALWGFNRPSVQVKLTFDENRLVELDFGKDKDNQFYVWIKPENKVVRVAQADFNKFAQIDWRYLRDRRPPFEFNTNHVRELIARTDKGFLHMKLTNGKWEKSGGSLPDVNPPDIQVTQLMDKLSLLSVEEFLEDLRSAVSRDLGPQWAEIELLGEEAQTLIKLRFGRAKELTTGQIKKSMVPVLSSKFEPLVFISETDFNRLEIPQFVSGTQLEGGDKQ